MPDRDRRRRSPRRAVHRADQPGQLRRQHLQGRVVNIEPSIQAAFVDFGVGRNGFLHISDVESQYFRQGGYDPDKPIEPAGGRRGRRRHAQRSGRRRRVRRSDFDDERRSGRANVRFGGRPRIKPPIQDIFRRGDEVLVQVIKEGIGTKGPTLSTYISIPGRYLVLMPGLSRVGVSRKIDDEEPAPQAPRDHARAEPAQGPGLHRPHRRPRPHQEGAGARPGLPAAALEGHRPPDQEDPGAGRRSTKKAT